MKHFICILTSIICAAFLSACQTGENPAPVKPVPETTEYTVTFAFDYDAADGPLPR